MKTKKQISKSILNRINSINDMLIESNELNLSVGSYAGSTHYSYLDIEKPIEVKNQFVYIFWSDNRYNYNKGKQRYNVNNNFDLDDLKYDLSLISREYKKELKKQLKTI